MQCINLVSNDTVINSPFPSNRLFDFLQYACSESTGTAELESNTVHVDSPDVVHGLPGSFSTMSALYIGNLLYSKVLNISVAV